MMRCASNGNRNGRAASDLLPRHTYRRFPARGGRESDVGKSPESDRKHRPADLAVGASGTGDVIRQGHHQVPVYSDSRRPYPADWAFGLPDAFCAGRS